MNNWKKLNNCTLFWWGAAFASGIAAYAATNEATSVFAALLLAAVVFLLVGFGATRFFCDGTSAGVIRGSTFTSPAVGSDTPSIAKAAALAAMERRPNTLSTPPPANVFGTGPKAAGPTRIPVTEAGTAESARPAQTRKPKKAAGVPLAKPAEPAKGAVEKPTETLRPDPAIATQDHGAGAVNEDGDVGTKPTGLDAPRGGAADNLKEIKGIGPKLEMLCNEMGFYHFDQIANWSAQEVAWVDANLKGFKGRVTRDNWIAQAKVLAAGGETEFSKRVEDGDVY